MVFMFYMWLPFFNLDIKVLQMKVLRESLEKISSELTPIHTKLVELKAKLAALKHSELPSAFTLAEINMIQDQLREIDSIRIDGKFISQSQKVVEGQGAVIDLLEECYDDAHELIASKEDEFTDDNPLVSYYEKLSLILEVSPKR